jgi:hypothetical protein
MLPSESSGLPGSIQSEQLLFLITGKTSILDLASSGVYLAKNVTIFAVGSYPAFSPLLAKGERYFFCGTFRIPLKRDPGRYPALCSMKLGLSSFRITESNCPG